MVIYSRVRGVWRRRWRGGTLSGAVGFVPGCECGEGRLPGQESGMLMAGSQRPPLRGETGVWAEVDGRLQVAPHMPVLVAAVWHRQTKIAAYLK